eukprot:g5374.t1
MDQLRSRSEDNRQWYKQRRPYLRSMFDWEILYCVQPEHLHELDRMQRYHRSGKHRSTDCTMTDEVDVSGDLTVTGNETVYSTLTAASGKRHFKISSGAHRVSMSWLRTQ